MGALSQEESATEAGAAEGTAEGTAARAGAEAEEEAAAAARSWAFVTPAKVPSVNLMMRLLTVSMVEVFCAP